MPPYRFQIKDHRVAIRFLNTLCENDYKYRVFGDSNCWNIFVTCDAAEYEKLRYLISITPEYSNAIKIYYEEESEIV